MKRGAEGNTTAERRRQSGLGKHVISLDSHLHASLLLARFTTHQSDCVCDRGVKWICGREEKAKLDRSQKPRDDHKLSMQLFLALLLAAACYPGGQSYSPTAPFVARHSTLYGLCTFSSYQPLRRGSQQALYSSPNTPDSSTNNNDDDDADDATLSLNPNNVPTPVGMSDESLAKEFLGNNGLRNRANP